MRIETWTENEYKVSTDPKILQIDRIHQFLSTEAYWSIGKPKQMIEKSIQNSLCFGLFANEKQIGFARVVSDFAGFAWLCDVYIEKAWQGKGLAKFLMNCIKSHSELQNLRRFCLATKDAHGLYEQFGFEVTKSPQNWMEIKNENVFKEIK